MKDLILKRSQLNQESVKIEAPPKGGKTFTELVAETGLSDAECKCIINQLINEKVLEAVSYVSGVSVCGGAITSTVYVEKVGEVIVKEAVEAVKKV